MKKLLLITGLLVALSGSIRSVDAQTTSIVGYGSTVAGEIHEIDLATGTLTSSFSTNGIVFQGLAIDPAGTTLYGSTGNGELYIIDITAPTPTPVLIGNMGLGTVEAMDFNFNGTELWVTDFDNVPTLAIYSINIDPNDAIPDATPTLVQTLNPALTSVVRAMSAYTTTDVWVARDDFIHEFMSVNTDPLKAPPEINVTQTGWLDFMVGRNPGFPNFDPAGPKIKGVDRDINGVLYGLANDGGIFTINEEPSILNGGTLDESITPRMSPVGSGNTGGHVWLALAIATADSTPPGAGTHNAVGELEIDKVNGQRIGKELEIETYNTDPELLNTWNSLFGVDPETSPDDTVTLQGPNRSITWEAGTLEMGGLMKMKVKTDKNDSTIKNVKITKTCKNDAPTLFVSGTGGVNPNLANGGWHKVEVEKMDNVTVTFDGYTITGFLKKLEVKLDKGGTTAAPLVKEFKLKIKGVTSAPDVKKGYVSSVVIDVPQTVVTAIAGTEYEEEVKGKPDVLSGHTEAEFEREYCAQIEGVDISSLIDGNNDKLEEREGPCVIEDVVVGN